MDFGGASWSRERRRRPVDDNQPGGEFAMDTVVLSGVRLRWASQRICLPGTAFCGKAGGIRRGG